MNQNNLKIDYMNISDLENIKAILEKDFDDFWNYNILKSELNNSNSTYFVAKQNDEIVGFAGVLIVFDEADITNIVVKKSFRGKRYFELSNRKFNQFLLKQKYC